MALFSVETRELRSFRIRHRIEELRSVIENEKTDGVFCVANSLYPVEREELRSHFNKHNVAVTSLSKNIIRFLFANTKWKDVRSLLEGQIFLIKNKENNSRLSRNFLATLTKDEKFTLRLFLHNHQVYRRERLKTLLVTPEQKNPTVLLLLLLKQVLVERTILLATRKVGTNSI